jgi:PKD repeat protein
MDPMRWNDTTCSTLNGNPSLTLGAPVFAGLNLTLNGLVVVTSGSTLTGIDFDWGDGTAPAVGCNYFPQSHTYATAGQYTVTVTVTGTNGFELQQSEIVTVGESPIGCSGVQGSIKFSPPLTSIGTASEKKVSLRISTLGACHDQNGKSVRVKKVVANVTLGTGSMASCTNFATLRDSLRLTVSYTTKGVAVTSLSFPAGSIIPAFGSTDGFIASGTATGTYAGAASLSVYLSSTSTTTFDRCLGGGSGSISSLQISNGTAAF